jgi:hypothetical protein
MRFAQEVYATMMASSAAGSGDPGAEKRPSFSPQSP